MTKKWKTFPFWKLVLLFKCKRSKSSWATYQNTQCSRNGCNECTP